LGQRRVGLRRVTRGSVVILTGDPDQLRKFWLTEYVPEVIDTEARRYPSVAELADGLGGLVTTTPVHVPLDCTDGFNEAYYGRPEMLLADGTWDRRHGQLRTQPAFDGSLILVTYPELAGC
jgi:hypothetical protein